MILDLETTLYLLKVFISAFLLCGGVLVSVVTWIVIKNYNKAEHLEARMAQLEAKLENEFHKFGVSLSEVHRMVKDEQHAIELRVVKLEPKGSD
jgi:hypothetical protein